MTISEHLSQRPAPGRRIIRFRGDTIRFQLFLPEAAEGKAFLRTNIGHGRIARRQIVRAIENKEPPLGRDWVDLPMKRSGQQAFSITLPLSEVGHFEAKAFFRQDQAVEPLWPIGTNTIVNVEPATSCCANIVYNAFVRQFGGNKSGDQTPDDLTRSCIDTLDQNGYTVIPPSGTFRDLIGALDFIIETLGCRWLQLLPVHPTPTTYARMGRFGSPYAALSFTAVDPALAQFDPKATPLEQFIELVDAIHRRHARILLDIAINHTGWAARLHETHPQWLVRDREGKIEVPGAWGVRWEDLTKLDYQNKKLWRYMADVFLTWCQRGVDGFRCDAGYMIPVAAWRYIVAKVRQQYPETIFLLEGLGGKISVTRDILNTANFNWAYSELFQNYDRGQIEHYLPEALAIEVSDGQMLHYAETHDNERLAAKSIPWAKMRTALCALVSQRGAFGFANGVEWLADQKIIVHDAPPLNWGHESNQVDAIRHLNMILRSHPLFTESVNLRMIQEGDGNCLILLRHYPPTGAKILIIANLDDQRNNIAAWEKKHLPALEGAYTDLLTGRTIVPHALKKRYELTLSPGQVLCLSDRPEDWNDLDLADKGSPALPSKILFQRQQALVLDILRHFTGTGDLAGFDLQKARKALIKNPVEFCRYVNPTGDEPRVIQWFWPEDVNRTVMLPPEHLLMVCARSPFRSKLVLGKRTLAQCDSLITQNGHHFALLGPHGVPLTQLSATLKLTVYGPQITEKRAGPLLLLPVPNGRPVRLHYHRTDVRQLKPLFLTTNGRGGMVRAPVDWGRLTSRYDALLAANMHNDHPEDRWVMFSRLRAWVLFQDYSHKIDLRCLESFHLEDYRIGVWRFHIPTGQGQDIYLQIRMHMPYGENALQLQFSREPAVSQDQGLEDNEPVSLILRPDIENRSFHDSTKAYLGPEKQFPANCRKTDTGVVFTPDPLHTLQVHLPEGSFHWEPEWRYMVNRAQDQERGHDPASDLFSPGFFSVPLKGGDTVHVEAWIEETPSAGPDFQAAFESPPTGQNQAGRYELIASLENALTHYVVRRGDYKTVIAGYPWFLDWGRDTLIAVRGLIAAGHLETSANILRQFARFERHGTIPNMIRGNDARNRDTSDAPLWLLVACHDYCTAAGHEALLDETLDGRSLRQTLVAMAQDMMNGTPNGIEMDTTSGLLFSPSHFTWMDTNHPAGTPREGYPIEIQALWYHALTFLAHIDDGYAKTNWSERAETVKDSIAELFWLPGEGYLSDCLLAPQGVPARQAAADDALRNNQLWAITMGAFDNTARSRRVLSVCQQLLVPGAIRSLADRTVRQPLKIEHNGQPLNNPLRPYQGQYQGDEDTQRKPAYHNGTAWTWPFPAFCEAWVMVYGDSARPTALAWLNSMAPLLRHGCIGHVPEIMDGNTPHRQKGCDAQAWGVSEFYRVWRWLTSS
jgi:predicted glycogen debranching enzyme